MKGKKGMLLLIVLLLVATLPIIVFVGLERQEIRKKAQVCPFNEDLNVNLHCLELNPEGDESVDFQVDIRWNRLEGAQIYEWELKNNISPRELIGSGSYSQGSSAQLSVQVDVPDMEGSYIGKVTAIISSQCQPVQSRTVGCSVGGGPVVPTSTPTPTPPKATARPTRNPSTPTSTQTPTPQPGATATPTNTPTPPTPTHTPTPTLRPGEPTYTPTPTPTTPIGGPEPSPTPTPLLQPTLTPTLPPTEAPPEELPQAGGIIPAVFGVVSGIVVSLLGLLL